MHKPVIINEQEKFFDLDSEIERVAGKDPYYKFATKEVVAGFKWLGNLSSLLDYGCGVGQSLQQYLEVTGNYSCNVVGVDISTGAINKIKARFNNTRYSFYKISENKLEHIANTSMEGAYIIHVLHHTTNHEDIFREIHSKLVHNGKLFICDLTSNNLLIRFFRHVFILMPHFVKRRFNDDLVVDDAIPNKYKVDISTVKKQLERTGFIIEDVGYGHLFVFVFSWLGKLTGLSSCSIYLKMYGLLAQLDDILLRIMPFRKQAELFYIRCTKA